MEEMRLRLDRLNQRLRALEPGGASASSTGQTRKRIQVLRAQRDALERLLAEMPPANDVSSQSWKGVHHEFEQAIGRLERVCERAAARARTWRVPGTDT